jgi:hypothetical protein
MDRDRRDPDKDHIEIVRQPPGRPQRDPDAEIVRTPRSQPQVPSQGSQPGGGRTASTEASGGRRDGDETREGTLSGGGSAGTRTGAGFTLPAWSRRAWLNILGVGLVALMGYMFLFSPTTPKTDEPTPQYQQERVQRPSLPTVGVSAADLDPQMTQAALEAANAGQPIPGLPNVPPSVVRDIRKGEVQFYSILVFDDHDEDGDIVKVILGNGMEYGPFRLTNKGTTISIPVKGGIPPSITLQAVKDGYPSYGVTCGIKASDGFWYSNILPEGSTQQVPFVAR